MVPIEQRLLKSKGWDWQCLEELALDIGYSYISQSGSHKKFRHRVTKENLIIPCNRDLRRTSSGIINKLRATYRRVSLPKPQPTKEIAVMPTTYTITPWKKKIRAIRESNGMTLRQVAEKMGVYSNPKGDQGLQLVYELECRNRRFAKFEFERWCGVFGLNPETQGWMNEFETDPSIIQRRQVKFGPFFQKTGTDDGHESVETEVITISHEPVVETKQPMVIPMPPVALPSPMQAVTPEPQKMTEAKPHEELRPSDILVAGELALNRYRDLEKLITEAEKARPEYDRLKSWLNQGSEILGI